jgi:hypothetical protein
MHGDNENNSYFYFSIIEVSFSTYLAERRQAMYV